MVECLTKMYTNIFIETFTIHIIFCPIAMAFVSNPSSPEYNQSSSGTD